ncbi:MAG: hypothetical protein HY289_05255, partial [Planctomycetes bacterium]|nr:hypothetical protein [Planctomycetota bacterium]
PATGGAAVTTSSAPPARGRVVSATLEPSGSTPLDPPGRNAPDYGAKYHIVGAPVYYHNYMMGELFASQVHHTIARKVYKGADPNTVVYVGNKEVGEFMRRSVFEPGATMTWNELTRHATGADLNPEAFAKDFGGK